MNSIVKSVVSACACLPLFACGQDCCSPRVSNFESILGSPVVQCWPTFITGPGSAMAVGNLWRITSTGSIYEYERNTAPYLWAEGQFFEARMQVVSGGISCCGIRTAGHIIGSDATGRVVSILVWNEGVAISTNQNIGPAPTFKSVAMDTTTSLHTYRLETDALGASLYIDGLFAAQVPYDSPHPSARNTASFGTDSRFLGESADTLWEYVEFSEIPRLCAADTNEDGVLNPADFSAWVAAFNGACSTCDQNGDAACTPADFSAWIANYNAGC